MSQPAYPARDRYRDPEEARNYDTRRFRSFRGQLVDRRERALVERALAAAGLAPGGRLLDLPAGTGRLAALFRAHGAAVIAADRSREMLRHAAEYEGKAVQADVVALPFRSGAFDLVVSLRLLGHLPPAVRAAALDELARVSRGPLIVACYDSTWVTRLRRRLGPAARRGAWFAEPLRSTRAELVARGFRVRLALPLLPFLSETWILLLERAAPVALPPAARP
jgi:SAM-dependent methyltransferase